MRRGPNDPRRVDRVFSGRFAKPASTRPPLRGRESHVTPNLPPTSFTTRPILPCFPPGIRTTLHAASQNDPSALALTLLKRLHVTRGKRDPDLVDLGRGGAGLVELLVVVHGGGFGFGDVVVGGVARGETAT